MHPAPSIILFTVLSGMGFGCLAYLGFFPALPAGWVAFLAWAMGYGLATAGLVASTFHLGQPKRAIKAFSQWRTSWLSREAWTSVAALTLLAPMALSDWLGLGWPRQIGLVGAVLCVAAVATTAMIYAQMTTIPRWHHWTTPVLFLAFMATGGALLTLHLIAVPFCVVLAVTLIAAFRLGDRQFSAAAETIGTATGLDRIGAVRVFELPHTGQNYLLREMIHVVARKHLQKLRVIALLAAAVLPCLALLLFPTHAAAFAVATMIHLTGALAARWLFFAEAEHVVGLYYGKR